MSLQRRRSCSCLGAYLLCAATLVVVVNFNNINSALASSSRSPQIFKVVSRAWSSCVPLNDTQACYRSRETACVRKTDNATASWYYCTDIGLERPHSLEQCPGSECVQDCAMTEWSAWSSCDCSAGFFRVRTRRIVTPARNGGKECPGLMEREECLDCFLQNRPFESLPRSYTWRTGEWGSCTAIDDDDTGCGDGLQSRAVDCIDTEGKVVNNTFCVNDLAYLHIFPPATMRLCEEPCQCQVEESWSDWSECKANCSSSPLRGYKRRTRNILRQPTMGETCPPTEETMSCTMTSYPNTCPTYSWEMSDWSPCRAQNQDVDCGVGVRERFAYCVETRDHVSVTVDSSFCDGSSQPDTRESCEIPCHQDCLVGEWSDWSECPKAATPTYSSRTRDVLLLPLSGGEPCPHLSEYKACPVFPSFQWVPEPYGERCYSVDMINDCGVGTRTRSISCQDLNGNDVSTSNCPSQSLPSNSEDCYNPCPDGCVVSDWSDWSECSATCGGAIGSQSHQRYFLAAGTSCPFTESDLFENRTCSNPQPCEEEVYYIIEDPWGLCMDDNPSLGDSQCGVGVQNRTAVCMKGDNAIPYEECAIPYEEVLQRPCNLPCECEYTEWSAYSECSTTCGSGMKTRSRRLTRFSSTDTNCFVDKDGFQMESTPCDDTPLCPSISRHAWYSSEYGDCVIFPSVLSQHSQNFPSSSTSQCGYGYKNRSVECHNVQGGHTVDDDLCLETGEEKPRAYESCLVACLDYCIVTEWSNYSQCTSDSHQRRSREIIPCSRAGDVSSCCPKLSSLQLSETIPCNRPDLSQYSFVAAANQYGECIISSPYKSCGNGLRFIPYACSTTDPDTGGLATVPEDYCSRAQASFEANRTCAIRCETDCQLSAWSVWGACSATCGRGTRMRTRSILREPEDVGRPCGALIEIDICENALCPYAEYIPGQFMACVLNESDSNSTCGMGSKTRQPICLVSGQMSDSQECQRLGATLNFDLELECTVPCDGECVASDWGEWSQCTCDSVGNCQHSRRRKILRDGTSCPSMLVDYRQCQEYTWRTLNWTSCILPDMEPGDSRPDDYCGNGTQKRSIECINNRTRESVHDIFCEGLKKPVQIQNCNIPCPVDCLVSAFSEWSGCPRSCDLTMETRERTILIPSSNGGRMCPSLLQQKPCPVNCYEYVYESHEPRCSPDYSAETQCGSALQSQPISCRRNNVFVPPSECLEAARQGLSVEGLNSPDVDLTSPTYCTISCPVEPQCNFTEWSAPSDCRTSCYDRANPFVFRTRALIRSFEKYTNSCLAMQYEFLDCPTVEPEVPLASSNMTTTALAPLHTEGEMECVAFTWQVSEWESDNSREIWCESNNGVRVIGGCPLNLMPLNERYPCSSKVCPDYSTCTLGSGLCQCSNRSEKVEGKCLPLSGCFEDGHCLIPNMQCDETVGQCVCSPGYELLVSA